MQIIVLGMHRSGTSLITRLINMMGAYFGPEKASLGFSPDNPKGYWERRDVMHISDTLLTLNDCTWNKLSAWPQEIRPAMPEQVRAIRTLLLDMDAHRPWVMKDSRLCLTLPYWLAHMEMPVVVLMHRDPLEIARSLESREGIPVDYCVALWECYAVSALNASFGRPRLYAAHATIMAEPVKFMHALKDQLESEDVRGLRMPSEREILAYVDKKLHRSRTASIEGLLTPHQQTLVSLMQGKSVQHSPVAISSESLARLQAGY